MSLLIVVSSYFVGVVDESLLIVFLLVALVND